MSTILNQINDNKGARKSATRVARGIGSGKGKTGGRGIKGQKSRSGVAINGFEGGQMPIHRRLPKRGFNNPSRQEYEVINLDKLQKLVDEKKIDAKKTLDKSVLSEIGAMTGDKSGIKLLAKGSLKTGLTIEVDKASEAAIKAVEKAGGKVVVVAEKKVKPASKKAKSE